MSDGDRRISAVLFDLGETLLTFGRINMSDLFRRSAVLSYDYLKGLGQPVGSFKSYCRRNLIQLRIRYFISNIIKKDFDALELLKKVNRTFALSEEQWEHLAWLWYLPLSALAQTEPDLHQTLTSLKNLGLKLGILSNTFIHGTSLDRHLGELSILEFFSVRLYSYQFLYRKPDPRIFAAAAGSIGLPTQNILFVGDRINNDIIPALKAGMLPVLKSAYTNDGKKVPRGIHKIHRLSELPALIQKLNGRI